VILPALAGLSAVAKRRREAAQVVVAQVFLWVLIVLLFASGSFIFHSRDSHYTGGEKPAAGLLLYIQATPTAPCRLAASDSTRAASVGWSRMVYLHKSLPNGVSAARCKLGKILKPPKANVVKANIRSEIWSIV
jgi:hypothetical protein